MKGLLAASQRIGILLSLALFALTVGRLLFFPYGADYGEAPLMDQAKRLQAGVPIYKPDLARPPYVIANYPPLYPALLAALQALTHLPWFHLGRGVSLLAALAGGVFLAQIAVHLAGNRAAGFLAAALFLGHPYTMLWSGLARVDALALAFSLAGLWLVLTKPNRPLWLALAALLLALAVFTRQTYLLAAPAASLVALWLRRRKTALAFAALLAGLCLAAFAWLNAQSNGGFYLHTVLANVNRYEPGRTLAMFRQLLALSPLALSLGAWLTATALPSLRPVPSPAPTQTARPALAIYFLGGLLSALTVGKVGSGVNYFLELIAAAALLSALAPTWLAFARRLLPALLTAQLLWAFIVGLFLHQTLVGARWAQLPQYRAQDAAVRAAAAQGQVLSDDFLDLVFLAGQPIYYQPFEYGQLYHAGLWDPTDLARQIRRGEFPLILIGGESLDKECCWPPALVSAIQSRYQVAPQTGALHCTPILQNRP